MTLPLIAVCGLGWGLQRLGRKLHSGGADIDEESCSSACACGSGDSDCSSGEGRSFWASLVNMIRKKSSVEDIVQHIERDGDAGGFGCAEHGDKFLRGQENEERVREVSRPK